MKRFIVIIPLLVFLFFASAIYAGLEPLVQTYEPNKKYKYYVIDDFEDADISKNPVWWGFGKVNISYIYNSIYNLKYLGKVSVKLEGKPKDHYIGGCGTYCTVDASKFKGVELIICGVGKYSGALMIEAFDDDNGNWQIEPHPHDPKQTLADDKFSYLLDVNWTGWRTVYIPFKYFHDANPGLGDDEWNPKKIKGSGGLVQLQVVALATKKRKKFNILVDSIKLYR
jgi:hypothetical protein